MDKIGVCIVKERVEERQQQVENKHDRAFENIIRLAAENLAGNEILQTVIREINIAERAYDSGNTDRDKVWPVFTAAPARVVYHIGTNTGKRYAGKRGNYVEDIHIGGPDADGAADDHIGC